MTTQEAIKKINQKGGCFFTVVYKRKNDSPKGPKKGSLIKILCRRGVSKYTLGVTNNKHSDLRNDVSTVFSITDYHKNKKIMPELQAGRKSYRRINLQEVISIS